MATKKATTAQRASDRLAFAVDCAKSDLRNLMTEQCRIPTGFATYYAGTRSQFIDAGFPEGKLPNPKGRRTKLRIAPGGSCYQSEADAWITPVDGGLELEIHWTPSGPGGCAHPALTEAARMACCSLGYWLTPKEWQSKEMPVQHLIDSESACDYQMSPDKRWLYTPAFAHAMTMLQHNVRSEILRGELMALQTVPASTATSRCDTASLDAERMARSLIATARVAR